MKYLTQLTGPPTAAQGIRFGNHTFSSPEVVADAGFFVASMDSPGLYVVMAYDQAWNPLPYRPLYFGESDRIWGRATPSHENYSSWKRAAGTVLLYRAFHYMPGSTRAQRQAAESALIALFGTPCNQRLSFNLADLLNRRS